MRDLHELAWLAGFWDGEGCVMQIKNYATPQFSLSQAGPEGEALCRKVGEISGLRARISGPFSGHRRRSPVYQVRITGGDNVQALLDMCRPWLSRTKIEQAERRLGEWRQFRIDNQVKTRGKPAA